MKVIFLDFNGVLDTYDNMDEINPENLNRLKRIVDDCDAKVVISSSLKNSYYIMGQFSKHFKQIVKELQQAGIEVIGITPQANTRQEEIELYLENHPEVQQFCILDDDYEMDRLKEHLVKLPSQQEVGQLGLEDVHMNMAIEILNSPLKDIVNIKECANQILNYAQKIYDINENINSSAIFKGKRFQIGKEGNSDVVIVRRDYEAQDSCYYFECSKITGTIIKRKNENYCIKASVNYTNNNKNYWFAKIRIEKSKNNDIEIKGSWGGSVEQYDYEDKDLTINPNRDLVLALISMKTNLFEIYNDISKNEGIKYEDYDPEWVKEIKKYNK